MSPAVAGPAAPVGPARGDSGPVAVDAMGGDRAPAEIVAGAIQAAEAGLEVVLVGDPDRLGDTGGLAGHPGPGDHRDARGSRPGRAHQEGLIPDPGR